MEGYIKIYPTDKSLHSSPFLNGISQFDGRLDFTKKCKQNNFEFRIPGGKYPVKIISEFCREMWSIIKAHHDKSKRRLLRSKTTIKGNLLQLLT
jgi:hypothetical protein